MSRWLFSARSRRPLRLCGEMICEKIHRGDAETAEVAQRNKQQVYLLTSGDTSPQ
jgi:hypothetical protein